MDFSLFPGALHGPGIPDKITWVRLIVFFPFTTSSFLLGLLLFLDCFFVVDSDVWYLDICAFIGLMDSYQSLPFGLNLLIYLPMCCSLCCRIEQCLFEVCLLIHALNPRESYVWHMLY